MEERLIGKNKIVRGVRQGCGPSTTTTRLYQGRKKCSTKIYYLWVLCKVTDDRYRGKIQNLLEKFSPSSELPSIQLSDQRLCKFSIRPRTP